MGDPLTPILFFIFLERIVGKKKEKENKPSFMEVAMAAISEKGAPARLGSDVFWGTDMLRTGIPVIDHVLGGGFAYGRMIELYGDFASGKSMVMYYAMAQCQRDSGLVVLIESEGAFDQKFYKLLGGDPSTLVLLNDKLTDTVEKVFDHIKNLLLVKKHDTTAPQLLICWDSIGATGTRHLQQVGMDKRDMSRAGSMAQGCDLITSHVKASGACVIATNQMRDVVGAKVPTQTTPGGHSWKFHSSQRMQLQFRGGKYSRSIIVDDPTAKDVELEIGNHVQGECTKNKLASSGASFTLTIYKRAGFPHPIFADTKTEVGIDSDEMLLDYLKKGFFFLDEDYTQRVVTTNGGWHKLHESIDPAGKQWYASAWKQKLEEFPKIRTLLYDKPKVDHAPPEPPGASDE